MVNSYNKSFNEQLNETLLYSRSKKEGRHREWSKGHKETQKYIISILTIKFCKKLTKLIVNEQLNEKRLKL